MKAQIGGTLVSTDRPVLIRIGLLVSAAVFAFAALRRYTTVHHADWGVIAIILVAAIALAASLTIPTTRFVFDPERKLITWTSGSFTNADAGELGMSPDPPLVDAMNAPSQP